jgi:hypothetical protein
MKLVSLIISYGEKLLGISAKPEEVLSQRGTTEADEEQTTRCCFCDRSVITPDRCELTLKNETGEWMRTMHTCCHAPCLKERLHRSIANLFFVGNRWVDLRGTTEAEDEQTTRCCFCNRTVSGPDRCELSLKNEIGEWTSTMQACCHVQCLEEHLHWSIAGSFLSGTDG